MRDNVYEIMYMRRQKDEYACEEIFNQFEGLVEYLVNISLAANPAYQPYRDDILQDVWITYANAIDAYRDDKNTSFKTFICLVVKRKLLQEYRWYTRHEPQFHATLVEIDSNRDDMITANYIGSEDNLYNPEYYAKYSFAREKIAKTISSLSIAEQNVLDCWIEGDSYQDAAEKLGITASRYGAQKQRIKRKIYQAIQ